MIQTPAAMDSNRQLIWLDAPPAWVIGLVLVPLLILLIWWSYKKQRDLSRGQRRILFGLRFFALLLALVATFRPAIQTTRVLKERSEVHFLIDDSASMDRHEPYPEEMAQAIRAALGPKAPEDLGTLSRQDLVRLFLGNPESPLLTALRKDFDLRWYRFSDHVEPIQDLEELQAKGSSTRIGDALDLHLVQTSGTNEEGSTGRLEAVILVSDGRNNEGLSPRESADRYRDQQIPVHVLAVGDPSSERNLVLSGPSGPQQVLRNEEAVFELDVAATGYKGREAELILKGFRKSGEEDQPDEPDLVLNSTSFVVPDGGKGSKVTITHTFTEPGDYILTFEVPPLPGETNPKDNVTRRYLRVDSNTIRVLYLDEQPRWEYRYIAKALLRVDKSIQVQALLFDADPNFVQEHSQGLPALTSLPRTKAELFQYDVILMGDVPPTRLGEDPSSRLKWMELVKEFVEHGGGLGFIAGEVAMPELYRETPLEDLLPVVIDVFGDGDLPEGQYQSFRPQLENPGAPHPIVKFSEQLDQNRLLWERGLPPMNWYYPVLRAKAGATVLLRHPEDENKYGRRVLAAIAPHPEGRVAFFGFDETWHWRRFYGEKYQDPYWRRIVRALAEGKLRRLDDRVRLVVERNQVDLGARDKVHLTLLDEDFNPVLAAKARIHLRKPDGKTNAVELARLKGQPGEFEATIEFTDAGVFSVLYYKDEIPGTRPLAREDVIVQIPELELAHPSMNEAGLRKLAEHAEGRFAWLHDLDQLRAAFEDRGGGQKIVDRQTQQIWDQAWTVLLILALLSLEWILRKRWNLI